MSEPTLFGTDGIRGRWGDFPLTVKTLNAIGMVLGEQAQNGKILFATDTRQSSPQILEALWRGVGSRAEICFAGIMPTPAISFLTRKGGFNSGVMITASHNPYEDNGIKIFNEKGEKLSERKQKEFEKRVLGISAVKPEAFHARPYAEKNCYVEFLNVYCQELSGIFDYLVFDCAHGATYRIAPDVLHGLAEKTDFLNISPDGKNINDQCGTEHIEHLKDYVLKNQASAGVAFDGDGDRVLFVTEKGELVQGETVLLVLARFLQLTEKKFNNKVITTIMANRALRKELARLKIDLLESPVGDRYVWQLMKKNKALLGGEPSGHIILSDAGSCGDGLLTCLMLFKALKKLEISFTELPSLLALYPQKVKSFPVRKKRDLSKIKRLQKFLKESAATEEIKTIVRFSGTEKKIRLFMEDVDSERLERNFAILEEIILSEFEIE